MGGKGKGKGKDGVKKIIDGKSIENIVLNSKMEVISILGAGNISENLNKEIFQNV